MDSTKQAGFTLFPTPPTPPARRRRTTASTISSTTTTSSNGTGKLFKKRGRGHGRKSSIGVGAQTQPALIPAPLKIRKVDEDVPPVPSTLPEFIPSTPTRKSINQSLPPKTPESICPQLPAIPKTSPISSLPRTPTRNGQRYKARTIAEFVELEAATKKRASARLSQWLDLEDGEIDRRRLSMYLGSVLGNTFEVPTFESRLRDSAALLQRRSRYELEALVDQFKVDQFEVEDFEIEQCECPPDAILCHCSSSPEFERFRSWSNHKQNSSVSSTACLLGVPRARFAPALFSPTESTIHELPSPPGLSFDTEDAFESDWNSPRTPSRDDVFDGSYGRKSYSSKYVVSSPSSSGISPPSSKCQSFSRPFRPDSTYRCMSLEDSAPSTPSRSQSRSTQPKLGFLTSISTVSSFDFDFDMKARRESLAFQKLFDLETLPEALVEKELSSHMRADSNESVTSQYEVSTATATVTMSRSFIKPVLVTSVAKRGGTPTPNSHFKSPNSSSSSSTSSFSIPDYWHQYNAGVRPPPTRSTTISSKRSTDSIALSALLTMPLLSPKLQTTEATDKPVPGNAFAQRSNTTATMPPSLSSSNNALSGFDFGTTEKRDKNEQPLLRSKTTPPTLKSYTNPKAKPRAIDTVTIDKTITDAVLDDVNPPVQAYTSVNTRLKAYMDTLKSGSSTTQSPPSPLPLPDQPTTTNTATSNTTTKTPKSPTTGLGLTGIDPIPTPTPGASLNPTSSKRRTKNYIHIDSALSRSDSGVFGRLSVLGAVPGRREFSEPSFFRR